MKRHVLLFGIVGGLLIVTLQYTEYRVVVIEHSVELYSALVAILFATPFGRAFACGILISLITSVCYVVTWEVLYFNFMPHFMDTVLRRTNPHGAVRRPRLRYHCGEGRRYPALPPSPSLLVFKSPTRPSAQDSSDSRA